MLGRRGDFACQTKKLKDLREFALVIARINDLERETAELVDDVVNSRAEFGVRVETARVDVGQVVEFEARRGGRGVVKVG